MAHLMKKIQNDLVLLLTKKLELFFGPKAVNKIQIDLKDDKSFVTEIDLFVSNQLKMELSKHPYYSNYAFYSEEDYNDYTFPCAILDPIDGTRELVKGRPECVVSLALMNSSLISDPKNFAWLYNPFSGFSLDSSTPFVASQNKSSQKLLALISRSELHNGLYQKYLNHPDFDISPRGSIAFKLGLLASGGCDFVVSLAPKNVWDIAAGTVLCEQRGIYFYQNGKRVFHFDHVKSDGVLIWATEELSEKVFNIFKLNFKNEINKSDF